MYAGWKLGRRVRSQSPYGAQSLATDDRAAPHEGWDWSQSPYGAQSLATSPKAIAEQARLEQSQSPYGAQSLATMPYPLTEWEEVCLGRMYLAP